MRERGRSLACWSRMRRSLCRVWRVKRIDEAHESHTVDHRVLGVDACRTVGSDDERYGFVVPAVGAAPVEQIVAGREMILRGDFIQTNVEKRGLDRFEGSSVIGMHRDEFGSRRGPFCPGHRREVADALFRGYFDAGFDAVEAALNFVDMVRGSAWRDNVHARDMTLVKNKNMAGERWAGLRQCIRRANCVLNDAWNAGR